MLGRELIIDTGLRIYGIPCMDIYRYLQLVTVKINPLRHMEESKSQFGKKNAYQQAAKQSCMDMIRSPYYYYRFWS